MKTKLRIFPLSDDAMIDLYWNHDLSLKQLAATLNHINNTFHRAKQSKILNADDIRAYFDANNIARRTRAESQVIARKTRKYRHGKPPNPLA